MANFKHNMTSLDVEVGRDHREIVQNILKSGIVVINNCDSIRAGVIGRGWKLKHFEYLLSL